jgi:integron integrase
MKKSEALKHYNEVMRLLRRSPKTIKVYLNWVGQYIDFISAPGSGNTREEKIGKFLSRLVIKHNVSATTQKQALCAIVRFYKWVLKEPIGELAFEKSSRAKRLPAVFSHEEVWRVLDSLQGIGWIWAALMYGCGLRLEEVCSLRVKDIDIDRRQLMVREGKGNKDRILPLPEMLVDPLQKHLRNIQREHADYSARRVPVTLPDALDKKYPSAPYSWEWFWFFPASGPARDPKWGHKLFHIHHSAIQKRIGRAIRDARIPKKASCHTLRHTFATHWLESADGAHEIAIIRLQKLMGHTSAETTMIYLHCVKQKSEVPSPLDARPALKVAA